MKKRLFKSLKPIILASSSHRRSDFLLSLGLDFQVVAADIDETPLKDEKTIDFALRMAEEKSFFVARRHQDKVVIAADTVIEMDGEIIGKPKNKDEAFLTLKKMQGRDHLVITAFSLRCQRENLAIGKWAETKVFFASFHDDVLLSYIATGEPLDKAGAYAIQGAGSFMVEKISGSCTTVIGLPMKELVNLLLKEKIIGV